MKLSQNSRSIEGYDLGRLENITAEKVLERVNRLLEEKNNICRCERCVLDLAAFVLNRVTPVYKVSLLGGLHPDQGKDRKLMVEIEVALKEGITRIKRHPHHD